MNMRLLIVAAALICTANCAIKCVQGTNGTAEATECTGESASATMCSSPKFVEYTGLSADVNYACGTCAGETKGSTCEECTGNDSTGCNKAADTGADFKCHSYTYNTTSKAFTKDTAMKTCKRLKDTAIKCNMPKASADSTTYTSTSGCGPCSIKTSETHCEACTTDSCNSAIRVAVLFAPLLAVLVHLF